jgi:hypothetical protein
MSASPSAWRAPAYAELSLGESRLPLRCELFRRNETGDQQRLPRVWREGRAAVMGGAQILSSGGPREEGVRGFWRRLMYPLRAHWSAQHTWVPSAAMAVTLDGSTASTVGDPPSGTPVSGGDTRRSATNATSLCHEGTRGSPSTYDERPGSRAQGVASVSFGWYAGSGMCPPGPGVSRKHDSGILAMIFAVREGRSDQCSVGFSWCAVW